VNHKLQLGDLYMYPKVCCPIQLVIDSLNWHWEHSSEEDVLIKEVWNNRRLEKLTQWLVISDELHTLFSVLAVLKEERFLYLSKRCVMKP
jgi:hypothetical protein